MDDGSNIVPDPGGGMTNEKSTKPFNFGFSLAALSFVLMALSGCNSTNVKPLAHPGKTGVVLMHGKGAGPQSVAPLKSVLEAAGVVVVSPTMSWSGSRSHDASFEQSMAEIDDAVQELQEMGAESIFVAGHSMGANAALGYGARHDNIRGLILLAPGHAPGLPGYARKVASAVDKARTLVERGQGDEKTSFQDINQNRATMVRTTPSVFLSWFDPNGPAVMSTNAGRIAKNVVVFCADGKYERFPKCAYIENNLPSNVNRKVISVNGDHVGVIAASKRQVVEWIREFDSP